MQAVIYIIDDHESCREGLKVLLQVHGYVVESFTNASDFLNQKNRQSTGCVITDLCMDDIDGLDLLIQLRSEKNLLPVILVSAYATVPEAVQIMKHGAITLIQKPYNQQEILNAIDYALAVNKKNIAQQDQEDFLERQFGAFNEEELQILELIASGASNKMIALSLDLSIRTIDRRRQAIFSGLNIDSVPELVVLYVEWSQKMQGTVRKPIQPEAN